MTEVQNTETTVQVENKVSVNTDNVNTDKNMSSDTKKGVNKNIYCAVICMGILHCYSACFHCRDNIKFHC